jgi:superfamily I DNA and/or RNA helicase
MHPELCALISSAVYENRLVAEAGNVNRQLVLPAELGERFKKRAGVWFVPVVHEGNTQASEEEADEIALLVADLLKCKISDKSGVERRMLIGDILIVAPYNMQVRMIQERIAGAQVASVDKFQGREATVVILSMCASDGNASPRGVAFFV